MLDKTKRYLVVGLGLLGGKYALELTKAGFHVDGTHRLSCHFRKALVFRNPPSMCSHTLPLLFFSWHL